MTTATTQLRSTTRWLSIPILIAFAACGGGSKSASQSTMLVSSAVKTFQVVPNPVSAPAGTKLTFAARATFADGTSRDVTTESVWTSANDSVVAVLPARGAAAAVAQGDTTLTATYQGVAANASVKVTPGLVLSITMTPTAASMIAGSTQQFGVSVLLSSSREDVTSVAAWTTSDAAVASVSASGLVTAVAAGTATLRASFGGAVVSAQVTVAPIQGLSITVAGADASGGITTAVGSDTQLKIEGVFPDGSKQDLTTLATCTSSNTAVATVDAQCNIHPVSPGSTVITVEAGGQQTTIPVTVLDQATLTGISIESTSWSAVVGGADLPLSAIGSYADVPARNITGASTTQWSVMPTSLATIQAGVVHALAPGDVLVTARDLSTGLSATATVHVKRLDTLFIHGATTLVKGVAAGPYSVTGQYSDGTSAGDVTALVTFTSDALTIAPNGSTATGQAVGGATITATLNGALNPDGTTKSTLIVYVAPQLTDITLSGGAASVTVPHTTQFTVEGVYSDPVDPAPALNVAWSVTAGTDGGLATIDNGVLTAIAAGTVTVHAGVDVGYASYSKWQTVTISLADTGGSSGGSGGGSATPTLASISPAGATIGMADTLQLSATSTTSADMTGSVVWTTSNASVATISAGGLLTPVPVASGGKGGTVTVYAVDANGTTRNASVTILRLELVVASPSIAKGLTTQVQLNLVQNDLPNDVTTSASWSVDAGGAISVGAGLDSNGNPIEIATGLNVGSGIVSATYQGIKVSAAVQVTSATVSAVAVAPAGPITLPVGMFVQLAAQATMSDNSPPVMAAGAVQWSTTPATGVVTVDANGFVQAVGAGYAEVVATVLGVASAPVSITVDGSMRLIDVVVTPPAVTLIDGQASQLTATATYANGNDYESYDVTQQATWTSSSPTVVSVDRGLVTATSSVLAATSVNVTASWGGKDDSSMVTVSPAALQSLHVTQLTTSCTSGAVPAGLPVQFQADATFTDTTTATLTSGVAWFSSDNSVAYFDPGTPGLLHTVKAGTVTVTATAVALSTTIQGTATLTVGTNVLQGITISASGTQMPVGGTLQLTATGSYTGGASCDITGQVSWLSSQPGVVSLWSDGSATGLKIGTTIVTAASGSVTSNGVTLSVVPATLTKLVLSVNIPSASAPIGIALNDTYQLDAWGLYVTPNGSQFFLKMTNQASWHSAPKSVAWITNSTNRGLVTGATAGTATVTARKGRYFDSVGIVVQ